VNFHNKQWLDTDTIVPDPAAPGRFAVTPKGYGIAAFTRGSAGQARLVEAANPGGINLTAYWVSGDGEDYVTIINKTHGAEAADAAVTITPPGPGRAGADVLVLAGAEPGDATGGRVTLGGVAITGDAPWEGQWSPLPAGPGPGAGPGAGPGPGISLTVRAATAAVVRIRRGG
jgi:hypothetical protein